MSLHFFYTLFPPGIGGLSAKLCVHSVISSTALYIFSYLFFKKLCLFYDLEWAIPDPPVSPPCDLK